LGACGPGSIPGSPTIYSETKTTQVLVQGGFCYISEMSVSNEKIAHAYNSAAAAYRKKYENIPVRSEDVDIALSLLGRSKPTVLEIGCAYGREAQHILQKTPRYTGIDISSVYIEMAKKEVPDGAFHCVDVLEYDFPQKIDLVFAFASLLHLSKANMKTVLQNIYSGLNEGGMVFLSLKHHMEYFSQEVSDQHSTRTFYYYNCETIAELVGELFSQEYYDEQVLKEPWFTLMLKKIA
jgi:SAM-dependent methyltransferase